MSLLPICVARRMRCASPPERVADARASERYPIPTSFRKPRRSPISFRIFPAISSSRGEGVRASKNAFASSSVSAVSVSMGRPSTSTASASGFNRRPLHAGQGEADMYISSSARASSLSTSLYLPSRSGTRPLKADDQLYSPFSDFHFHLISRSPEPWRITFCTSLPSFLNGTSSENFITFARCSICLSRQLAEPCLYSAIAPSRIDFDGSGMSRSGSTFCTVPRPLHEGHAPNGELNEKRRGVISVSEVPQSGQAS